MSEAPAPSGEPLTTARHLLVARADEERPALLAGDLRWSWRCGSRVTNLDACVGELVNTTGSGPFAGYYGDEVAAAERLRGGMYWSGDLAYRDADGKVLKRELQAEGLADGVPWTRDERGTSYV